MTTAQTIKKTFTKNYILVYKPAKRIKPENLPEVISEWCGLELIIEDILDGFDLERISCIEFGVGSGFSAAAFSNYFEKVTSIDIFGEKSSSQDLYEKTRTNLAKFDNLQLLNSDLTDWITTDENRYSVAHIDIVPRYDITFECGLWAALHADCTLFHNTESSAEVRQAAIDIAAKTGHSLYNYPHQNGLGILIDKAGIKERRPSEL